MSEAETRALRDKVFEKPISDAEWQTCRDNWMQSEATEWLKQQAQEVAA